MLTFIHLLGVTKWQYLNSNFPFSFIIWITLIKRKFLPSILWLPSSIACKGKTTKMLDFLLLCFQINALIPLNLSKMINEFCVFLTHTSFILNRCCYYLDWYSYRPIFEQCRQTSLSWLPSSFDGSTSLFSFIKWCSILILHIFCSTSALSHFSQEPWFHSVGMVL